MNSKEVDLALKEVTLIALAGRPGCGKEFTGDELLRMHAGYNRIIMSQVIDREKTRGTGPGMLMKQYQDAGHLVPDEFVVNLFLNEVAALHKEGCKVVITDGFPRNKSQRGILKDRKVRFVMFFLELAVEKAVKRMLERGRPGENEAFCRHRQEVFKTQTLPMIEDTRETEPDSFIQIDASLESDIRARIIHEHVSRLSQAVIA